MELTGSPAPRVTVRLTPDRAAELEECSRRSHRTVAGELRYALERHLAATRAASSEPANVR